MGNRLARLLGMQKGFAGLLAQPRHDRDAVESEYEQRVVGVSNDAGQFLF